MIDVSLLSNFSFCASEVCVCIVPVVSGIKSKVFWGCYVFFVFFNLKSVLNIFIFLFYMGKFSAGQLTFVF